MSTTVQNTIAEIKRQVYGTTQLVLNKINANIDTTATTFTFTYDLGNIARNAYIGIGDEVCYVWSTNPTARTAVVERAMLGTTATTHAINDLAEVAPRFPNVHIRNQLEREIRSWEPTLYTIRSQSYTVGANASMIDLASTTGLIHPLEVYHAPRSGSDQPFPAKFRFGRDLSATHASSGNAIFFDAKPGAIYYQVVYAGAFSLADMSDATDLVATAGLQPSMLDLAALGTAWRLLATQDVKRTQTEAQPEPRRAEEVPVGMISQTAEILRRIRASRLAEEADKLRVLHGAKARYG
jgi:hypothetical protein